MFQKVDILASFLGISFFVVEKDSEEVAHPRDCCGQCGKKKRRILSPLEASMAPLVVPSTPTHPTGFVLPSTIQKQERSFGSLEEW